MLRSKAAAAPAVRRHRRHFLNDVGLLIDQHSIKVGLIEAWAVFIGGAANFILDKIMVL